MLSKKLARHCGIFVKAVESQTLKTVGFEGLSQTTEDILYHLYPKCDKIDHSITNGEDFWHQFYQSYVITESALSPYVGGNSERGG